MAYREGTTYDNPAHTQGELGLIVSLFGFTVGIVSFGLVSTIGFLISARAMYRSHRAGYQNGPAKWGMIFGSGPLVLATLAVIAFMGVR